MYKNDLELDLSRSMTCQSEQKISEMSSTQKINTFRGITFDSTPKNKKVSFSKHDWWRPYWIRPLRKMCHDGGQAPL